MASSGEMTGGPEDGPGTGLDMRKGSRHGYRRYLLEYDRGDMILFPATMRQELVNILYKTDTRKSDERINVKGKTRTHSLC